MRGQPYARLAVLSVSKFLFLHRRYFKRPNFTRTGFEITAYLMHFRFSTQYLSGINKLKYLTI